MALENKFNCQFLTQCGGCSEIRENSTGYRNRVLLRVRPNASGKLDVGYFAPKSRNFVAIDRCEVADKSINALITEVRNLEALSTTRFRLEIQKLLTKDAKVLVSLTPGAKDMRGLEEILVAIRKFPIVAWAGFSNQSQTAPWFLFENDLDINFYTKPGVFQQVNQSVNKRIRRRIAAFADEVGARKILDLYCGSGNFSLPLCHHGRHVTGVEVNQVAAQAAQHSVAQNQLKNVNYLHSTTRSFLTGERPSADLVILDPPRAGLEDDAAAIAALETKHLLYISCNAETLEKDLKIICADKYALKHKETYDMFPNTTHFETLAFLTRRS